VGLKSIPSFLRNCGLGFVLLAAAGLGWASEAHTNPLNRDPLVREAYQHFYNQDYPGMLSFGSSYTSLNLAAANKARFRYRMEGHETAWTDADANTRIAHYPKLPPGDYTFHVKACNEDGFWNEAGATLGFQVEPPFWQKWWFRSAVVIFVFGWVSATVYYFSTQKLQRQLGGLRQQQALQPIGEPRHHALKMRQLLVEIAAQAVELFRLA